MQEKLAESLPNNIHLKGKSKRYDADPRKLNVFFAPVNQHNIDKLVRSVINLCNLEMYRTDLPISEL